MNTRKCMLFSLLAIAILTSFSGSRSANGGPVSRGVTRGAHYRVTMRWQNISTRQLHTTSTTVTYYWRGGLRQSDNAMLVRHLRHMNSQGWRLYNYRYEHPRYF